MTLQQNIQQRQRQRVGWYTFVFRLGTLYCTPGTGAEESFSITFWDLSTIRICFDDLSLDLVQASVESESQKLEHNLEESNVWTKTKIKERLKDENKCFLHKHFLYYKQSGYPAENMCHT